MTFFSFFNLRTNLIPNIICYFLVGVEVPFKNCNWFSKYFELLTPWYAGIAPKYILVHLDYGNSWPFSITQRVKGRRSPTVLWGTPAEFPVTQIALWYWLQPFAQLGQVHCIASNNGRLFYYLSNLICWKGTNHSTGSQPPTSVVQRITLKAYDWGGKFHPFTSQSLWQFTTLVLTNLLIEYLSRIAQGEHDEMGWTRKTMGGPLCRQAKTETFKGTISQHHSSVWFNYWFRYLKPRDHFSDRKQEAGPGLHPLLSIKIAALTSFFFFCSFPITISLPLIYFFRR